MSSRTGDISDADADVATRQIGEPTPPDDWARVDASRDLDRVIADVRAGDVAVLIGPSGGGKSVILELVLGLLQPDAGSSRVNAVASTARRARAHGGSRRHWREGIDLAPTAVWPCWILPSVAEGSRMSRQNPC